MKFTLKFFTTAALLLAATTASAHSGHSHGGFVSGLLHPMLGPDHLLAMAAIGFWSVRQSPWLQRGTPLFMVAGMFLGAGLAFAGLTLPGVETGIALTVMLAGVLIATLAKLPTVIGGTLVGSFMVFHGFAHGTEMPAAASLLTYMAGFGVATLAIALAGRGLGVVLAKTDNRVSQALGAVLAATGAFLVA
ncbi:MAG: HupE/UreJ family protein [Marinobacter sp.]|uniref:HupE/UreJ family protein n=1 Tax=Marinobacter sp. TaxID=50741 RepID=UPI00299F33EB|nr:HupE/UreJ family protein [Marinobacter sp.]MDX1636082.1 HupE/UreJ family protein [Marinobacter sp.]